MGDKKDDSGLFGWKNWKIPDEWTVVARDRTPVSVSFCPAMLSSVIVLMKLRSSRIELASDPIENIHSTFNIQLHFIFFSFIADLGKIWPGLRLG